MDGKQINREQASKLGEHIGPMMNYCLRVRNRMDKTVLQIDRIYALVDNAYNAMHALNVELHYRAVGSGCGRAAN